MLRNANFEIRVTGRVPLMEQELHTRPEHLRPPSRYLVGLLLFVVPLHVFAFLDPCCDICYELLHLFCRRFMLYLLFTFTGVQHDFHIRLCSCHWTVTQRVQLVEQELLTLPGHLSSPPVYSGARVAQSLAFCVVFGSSLFVSLTFSFWSLYFLFFFDLQLLQIRLISSNCSCEMIVMIWLYLFNKDVSFKIFIQLRTEQPAMPMWLPQPLHQHTHALQKT